MNYYFALFAVLAAMFSGTTWTLIGIGGGIVFIANIVFLRWALKQLRVEPSDEFEASTGASNAIGDSPIRTSVGVPRNRSLRPRDPAAERGGVAGDPAVDTAADRKETAGAGAASSPASEPARQGALASFEPLIPFSPGASSKAAAATADPAAAGSSKTPEAQPAGSLIALATPTSPATAESAPLGALILPPLHAGDAKSEAPPKPAEPVMTEPAAKAAGPLDLPPLHAIDAKSELAPKPAEPVRTELAAKVADPLETAETVAPISSPIRPASATSADLILVDKNTGSADAVPLPPEASKTSVPSAADAGLVKSAELVGNVPTAPDAPRTPEEPSSKTPQPEAEGTSAQVPLPALAPPDTDTDDVKKTKTRTASAPSPEGALTASVIPSTPPVESKPAPLTVPSDPTGLTLPPLTAATPDAAEPEKPPIVLAKSDLAPEPPAADILPLPPLEPAVPAKAETRPKSVTRSRIFLPADIPAVPPATPSTPATPPADTAGTDEAKISADYAPIPASEPPVTPAPAETTEKIVAKPEDKAPEPIPSAAPLTALEAPVEVVQPPVSHLPVAEPEPPRSAAVDVQAEKPADVEHPLKPTVTDDVPSSGLAELKTPEPTSSHIPDSPLPAHRAEEAREDSAIDLPPAASAGLVELPEDTSHLTAKASEAVHVPEMPVVSEKVEPPKELPVATNDAAVEVPIPAPVVETAKTEEPAAAVSVPNPGLSPVDAQHIHGASLEPTPARDDSPHDLPIQLAAVEPATEPVSAASSLVTAPPVAEPASAVEHRRP